MKTLLSKLKAAFLRWAEPNPGPSWVRFDREGNVWVDTTDPAWQARVLEQCQRLQHIEKTHGRQVRSDYNFEQKG